MGQLAWVLWRPGIQEQRLTNIPANANAAACEQPASHLDHGELLLQLRAHGDHVRLVGVQLRGRLPRAHQLLGQQPRRCHIAPLCRLPDLLLRLLLLPACSAESR